MQKITGVMLKKMFSSAFALLDERKAEINALNVFPVPDGDTGTNMSLTLKSAVNDMAQVDSNNIEAIAMAISKGALKGARGNSGVILSQILKGHCQIFQQVSEITIKTFSRAIQEGAVVAYKAVTLPKEGTILSVIRAMAEGAKNYAKSAKSIEEFLEHVIVAGEEMLVKTPDMLPVLKKAGVVDAGGRGLITIFSGMYKALTGEYVNIDFVNRVEIDVTDPSNHVNYESLADIQFAYCTEFFVINIFEKTTEADINALRRHLMDIGDSVICIGDLSLIKVHVHTNEPNKALGFALKLGELNGVKIENMLEQNRALKKSSQDTGESLKEIGIVSIVTGDGLKSMFGDLEVDYCLSGGQSMNPSAEDIKIACDKVNAKNIIVLPNNKNIHMACKQANELSDKNIVFIPTKSIPEGVSACIAFNKDESLKNNIQNMTSAIKNVKSASVTTSARTTKIDGFELKEGEFIGVDDKTVLSKGSDSLTATLGLIEKMVNEDVGNITLFYGEDISDEEASILQEKLEEHYSNIDISVISGGQPLYHYLISVE